MIIKRPLWKRAPVAVLLVLLAAGTGAWLALDRPLPDGWIDEQGQPALRLPELGRNNEADRIFCAESPETGICRCITSSGERPEIAEEECRRRARQSATD